MNMADINQPGNSGKKRGRKRRGGVPKKVRLLQEDWDIVDACGTDRNAALSMIVRTTGNIERRKRERLRETHIRAAVSLLQALVRLFEQLWLAKGRMQVTIDGKIDPEKRKAAQAKLKDLIIGRGIETTVCVVVSYLFDILAPVIMAAAARLANPGRGRGASEAGGGRGDRAHRQCQGQAFRGAGASDPPGPGR